MNSKAMRNTAITLGLIGYLLPALAAPPFDLGKREYESNCAICHGSDGKGNGAFGDLLVLTIPDLTTLSTKNGGAFPTDWVYGVIDGRIEVKAHGVREMPIWGNYYSMMSTPLYDDYHNRSEAFVRARIIALIDYLKRLQK